MLCSVIFAHAVSPQVLFTQIKAFACIRSQDNDSYAPVQFILWDDVLYVMFFFGQILVVFFQLVFAPLPQARPGGEPCTRYDMYESIWYDLPV